MTNASLESVKNAWDRLEAWCRRYLPTLLDTLNPGATAAEITNLEQIIQQPLPEDVRVSLSIHNGQHWQNSSRFIFGLDLLDAERISEEGQKWRACDMYNEEFKDSMRVFPEDAIKLDYANPGWIPLTRDGGGNHLGVDLAPGPAGAAGQVISFGRDEELKCVLGPSWGDFLLSYAKFLESGVLQNLSPEPKFWSDNFEPVMVARHRHDVLIEWRKQGRWPLD